MSYLYFASFYPADFIRNPIKAPGRGPCGFRRPGRRPGGAGHGEAVASGLSSAGELQCLGKLFSPTFEVVSEQYDFPNVVEKDIVVIYLFIYLFIDLFIYLLIYLLFIYLFIYI